MKRIGVENGFVRDFVAKALEAIEFLDGSAVLAFGLGLVTEKEAPGIAAADQDFEAGRGGVAPIVFAADLFAAGQLWIELGEDAKLIVLVEDGVHALHQKPGLEAGAAEHLELADGDALDGVDFLRVPGKVGGEGVGAQVVELAVFQAEDGNGDGGEAVLAGILGGAGLPGGSPGAGRFGGIGPVGSELFVGDRMGHGDPDVARRLAAPAHSIL